MKNLFLLVIVFVFTQVYPQNIDQKIIDNIIIKSLPISGPGGALLIMKNGNIEYKKAFGFADVENKIPNSVETVFQIGSVSKQMTAAAILMLAEENKLSLDDTLTKYIPDFISPGNKVTIKNLLLHNSGIPSYTELPDRPFDWESKQSLDDIINLLKDREFNFQPGKTFNYNNSGYAILAYIIEKVSGMNYGKFMKEKIFFPLKMDHTRDGGSSDNIGTRAIGYTINLEEKKIKKAAVTEFPQLAGAGSIISTIGDIAIWDEAVKSKKLLSEQSWNEALSTQINAEMFGDSIYYGYGWLIHNYKGHNIISHTGGMAGFLCANNIYLDDDVTIIWLSNNDFVNADKLENQIANYIFRMGENERASI
ncbi:MAG: serine hydrolase domain-containing protein, partial [Ignavibacteriaceae bacterium]